MDELAAGAHIPTRTNVEINSQEKRRSDSSPVIYRDEVQKMLDHSTDPKASEKIQAVALLMDVMESKGSGSDKTEPAEVIRPILAHPRYKEWDEGYTKLVNNKIATHIPGAVHLLTSRFIKHYGDLAARIEKFELMTQDNLYGYALAIPPLLKVARDRQDDRLVEEYEAVLSVMSTQLAHQYLGADKPSFDDPGNGVKKEWLDSATELASVAPYTLNTEARASRVSQFAHKMEKAAVLIDVYNKSHLNK